MKYFLILIVVTNLLLMGCSKEGNGVGEPQGGLLPSNYIIIKDGAFSPANTIAVRGASFTFVNQSGSTKGIYSNDSIVINKASIDNNASYYFKKDTVGTVFYFMAGKPSVQGSITLTP
jgi:hypothetical protein